MLLTFGPFSLDATQNVLLRDDQPVAIGLRGLALLQKLIEGHGAIVSKAVLMDAAWPGLAVEESNLSVQIAALRKILGPGPDGRAWIATVPRGGYRLVDGIGIPAAAPAIERPSILVLPFANVSGNKEQDYLADGITEDLIVALTRFRWFNVIARNTSFFYKSTRSDLRTIASEVGARYVVSGSLRKSGSHLRITAELADPATVGHIWGDRYDLEFTEVFAIQDEIAERVAGAIEPELLKSESTLSISPHTGNITAWTLVRRGMFLFHKVQPESHREARRCFGGAVKLDPQLPEAHIWLARVDAGMVAYGWSHEPEAQKAEGLAAARQAILLDERSVYAHYALAIVSTFADNLGEAQRAAQRAVEISPSFALGHLVLGMARLFAGEATGAVAPLQHGLRLSPHDPQNFVWHCMLALAQLFSGSPHAGRDSALRALAVRPGWDPGLRVLIACHAAMDQRDEAALRAREITTSSAPANGLLAPFRLHNPHWAAQLDHWMREARRSIDGLAG